MVWSNKLEDSYMLHTTHYLINLHPVLLKISKNHNMLNHLLMRKIQQLIILSNGHYIMTNENNELTFWNLKLGLKGFDENASPFIWSYVIKNNNKGQIFLDETNEKMDALKIQERDHLEKQRILKRI